MCAEGAIRNAEGDMGRKGEEFIECSVTHPDNVGMDAMKELVWENMGKALSIQ